MGLSRDGKCSRRLRVDSSGSTSSVAWPADKPRKGEAEECVSLII